MIFTTLAPSDSPFKIIPMVSSLENLSYNDGIIRIITQQNHLLWNYQIKDTLRMFNTMQVNSNDVNHDVLLVPWEIFSTLLFLVVPEKCFSSITSSAFFHKCILCTRLMNILLGH